MSRTVLVLGANGFIGAHVAVALARADWTVCAGARKPDAARACAPGHDWVQADFAKLTQASAWTPLLSGVDAVVNWRRHGACNDRSSNVSAGAVASQSRAV